MIEAFERNLRLQKIKLQVENAETEDELVQIFEKYLESKKPKETKPSSIMNQYYMDQYYDAKYVEIMKQNSSQMTTSPVLHYDQQYNYYQASKAPLDLVVFSEIDSFKLNTFSSQEQALLVEREKKHLEHLLLEELVRGNHIEHSVVSDVNTAKMRLKARLRG